VAFIKVTEADSDEALEWAAQHFGMSAAAFKPANTLIVHTDQELLAVLIYHEYREYDAGNTIEATIVARNPGWATRRTLRILFGYAFNTCKAIRFGVQIQANNAHAIDIVKRLGYKQEGRIRRGGDGQHDWLQLSMLKNECRWLAGRPKKEQKVTRLHDDTTPTRPERKSTGVGSA